MKQLRITWSEFKTVKTNMNAVIFYALTNPATSYLAYISCPLFYAECFITAAADVSDFQTNYLSAAVLANTTDGALALALSSAASANSLPVSIQNKDASNFIQWKVPTHDFTDPTTWYQNATQVVTATLTTSDNLTFSSANINWINPDSSLLFNQSFNIGVSPYTQVALWMLNGSRQPKSFFRPLIYINSVLQTSGYTINYRTGQVVFASTVSGTVTATYFYATTSAFVVSPPSGVTWQISYIEINTTSDIVFNATTYLQYWRDPNYLFTSAPFKVSETPFQSIHQVLTAAAGKANVYPPIGGSQNIAPSSENGFAVGHKRGTNQSPIIIPFEFRKPFVMSTLTHDAIRFFINGDVPHLRSDFFSITFYVDQFPLL